LSALVPHLHWLLISGAPPFAYALARHTGKAFAPSVIEAALFILGLALVLALPAAIWVLMAKGRLKQVPQDFWAMNSGLLLLFLVGVGTIVFPVITSVVFGTDMPPIWGLQGLTFLVRDRDGLRRQLSDSTVLFGQSGGAGDWDRGGGRRRGGARSRALSQRPSVTRGA
jgi:hypothetical protein